jgi:hypothetical protein
MPVLTQCQACGRRLRVPSKYVERLVTCTKCGAAVRVPRASPPTQAAPVKPPSPASVKATLPEPKSTPDRLGVTAMALGALSILILCLPYIGYGSLILSSIGIILALAGLGEALVRSMRDRLPAAGGTAASSLSLSSVGYTCAGISICLLALTLGMVVHAHH